MPTTNHHHTQAHRYCIFSQKPLCLGFPDEPDHPACNCIYVFTTEQLLTTIKNDTKDKDEA